MDREEIYENIFLIVKETIGGTDVIISDETDFIEEGLISSLKLVEMIIRLEERFSIEFDTFLINTQNFATIASIFEIISNELKKEETEE